MKHIARQFLAGLLAIGLLCIPLAEARAAAIAVPSKVSIAVAEAATNNLIPVADHLAAGTITAADYATMHSTLSTLFANWEESGFTAELQAWILANQSAIETAPTAAELRDGWAKIAPLGTRWTEAQYLSLYSQFTAADRALLVSTVKAHGLEYLHAQILADLLSEEAAARNHSPDAHLHFAGGCHAPYLSIAALYLGIVALAVTGPVGIAIAVGGLAAGGAGLLTGC